MKYIIIIIIILASCTTQKRCAEKFPPQSFDSTVISRETIWIDRVDTVRFTVPPKIVSETKYVYVDKETGLVNSDRSVLNVDFAESIAYVNGSRLFHELNQKDSTVTMTFKNYDKLIRTMQSHTRVDVVKETTNILTGWQWFQVWIGRIVLIALVLFGIYKILIWKVKGISRILR